MFESVDVPLHDRQAAFPRTRLASPVAALAAAALVLGAAAPSAGAHKAYVVNTESASVSVIDTNTNQTVGSPIPVGDLPGGIAVTPDGRRAYVTSATQGVWRIDTETNQVSPLPIAVTGFPHQIAITADGGTALLVNAFASNITSVDLQLGRQAGPPIPVESEPTAVAVSPDGRTGYVLRGTAGRTGLTILDLSTGQILTSIPLGPEPGDVAPTPDGKTVYVTESSFGSATNGVWVIDTGSDQVVGLIPVGEPPYQGAGAIAIAPDGKRAYVVGYDGNLWAIDTESNQVVGSPIPVGQGVGRIALTPDGHTAYLTDSHRVLVVDLRTGEVVGNPIPVSGYYIAIAQDLPSVRVDCPAGGDGCTLGVQAVSSRVRGSAQSTITTATLRSKRPRLVPLRPRHGFARRIAKARRLWIKETFTAGGVRRTKYRRLKVFR
jgi:YVTN family beta-propeller protein